MAYWLVKSEPTTYSINDLVRDKSTHWDGVRNYQARNNLKLMKKGDICLFYHSGDDKAVMGEALVRREYYPDAKADEKEGWVMVDVAFEALYKTPVTLARIKAEPILADIPLIRQSRLSVMPITKTQYEIINQLGKN